MRWLINLISLIYSSTNLAQSKSHESYGLKRFYSTTDLTTPVNYYEAKNYYLNRPWLSQHSKHYDHPNYDLWYGYSRYYPDRYFLTRRPGWYLNYTEPLYSYYVNPRNRYFWEDASYRPSLYSHYEWPYRYAYPSYYSDFHSLLYTHRPYYYSSRLYTPTAWWW